MTICKSFCFKYVCLLIIKMSNINYVMISYPISFLHIEGQIGRRSIDDVWVGNKEHNMRYVVIIELDNNTNLNWIMSITSFLPLSYLAISKCSCSHGLQLGCDDTSPAQVTFFGKLSTQTFQNKLHYLNGYCKRGKLSGWDDSRLSNTLYKIIFPL